MGCACHTGPGTAYRAEPLHEARGEKQQGYELSTPLGGLRADQSLATVREVRDPPDRPGREFEFLARKLS